jgi:AraC-like DNA-binding protein
VNRGAGTYEIEDRKYEVKQGDVVIINGVQKHRVVYDEASPLFETVIHFDRELVWSNNASPTDHIFLKLFSPGRDFDNKPDLSEHAKGRIKTLVEEITGEVTKKEEYYELVVTLLIKNMIALILRENSPEGSTHMRPQEAKRIKDIIDFINVNAYEGIGMRTVADAFFMNASYFSDYFKNRVGINFSEYLARIRINRAIRMMEETENTTAFIAMSCGYNSLSCFYTAFKKIMGISPSKYIKK